VTAVTLGGVAEIRASAWRANIAAMNYAAWLTLGFALASSGCATTADCGGDWYAHGWRDGRYGAFAQAELYARRCATVDVGEYNRGWRDGAADRPTLGGM
jgi:hypothetical protein